MKEVAPPFPNGRRMEKQVDVGFSQRWAKGAYVRAKGDEGIERLDNVQGRSSITGKFPQKGLDFWRSQSKPNRLMGKRESMRRGTKDSVWEESGNREYTRGGRGPSSGSRGGGWKGEIDGWGSKWLGIPQLLSQWGFGRTEDPTERDTRPKKKCPLFRSRKRREKRMERGWVSLHGSSQNCICCYSQREFSWWSEERQWLRDNFANVTVWGRRKPIGVPTVKMLLSLQIFVVWRWWMWHIYQWSFFHLSENLLKMQGTHA